MPAGTPVWLRADNAYHKGELVRMCAARDCDYSISVTNDRWRGPVLEQDASVLGDERLGADGIFGFSVASFVMPQERNVVLNPDHPDFASPVTHGDVEPFKLDERLLLR